MPAVVRWAIFGAYATYFVGWAVYWYFTSTRQTRATRRWQVGYALGIIGGCMYVAGVASLASFSLPSPWKLMLPFLGIACVFGWAVYLNRRAAPEVSGASRGLGSAVFILGGIGLVAVGWFFPDSTWLLALTSVSVFGLAGSLVRPRPLAPEGQ
jgi:hypothetical protein